MVGNGKIKRWRFLLNKTKSEKKTKPLDEFICPISGLLMFDPVIVSSGQTFERISVQVCRELDFVPLLPDGSKPDFSTVIANLALKKAITSWCESSGTDLPRYSPDYSSVEGSVKKLMSNSSHDEGDSRFRVSERDLIQRMAEKPEVMFTHAATQLNPQSVDHRRHFYSSSSEESVIANIPDTPPLPLVTRPSCYSSSPSASTSSEIVVDEGHETLNPNSTTSDEQNFCTKLQSLDVYEQEQTVILLRKLTRTDEEARVSLCTPRLLLSLRECVVSRYACVQTNAVAALVNLSLEKINKVKIVRSGIVPLVIDVLKCGVAEAQEHAAGAIFSLALEEENKTAIGVLGALQPLLHSLRSDSERTRHDSALALYHLSLVQSNRVKLVKLGAVSTLLKMLETDLAGRILLVLCNLAASSEGKSALLDSNAVECLFQKLRTEKGDSTESTRENCVACLYSPSLGNMRFRGLAKAARAGEVLPEVEERGSERAREKAKRMLMMLRERDDGQVGRDWEALLEGGVSRTRYGGTKISLDTIDVFWTKLDKLKPSFMEHEEVDVEKEMECVKQQIMTQRTNDFSSIVGDQQLHNINRLKNWIPSIFHQYISRIRDVRPDGNCGFRSVALGLRFNENKWKYVRQQLLEELDTHELNYREVFNTLYAVQYNELRHTIDWQRVEPAPEEHWMIMPYTGIVIAQRFGVILHLLSNNGCQTFFPLWADPNSMMPHHVVSIVHVNNNHFVHVKLDGDYPMPTLSNLWILNRNVRAAEWEIMYRRRISKYNTIIEDNRNPPPYINLF